MPESIFASPYHQAQLSEVTKDGQLYLATMDGDAYSVTNGIPDLTVPRALEGKAKQIHDFYSSTSEIYDQFVGQTFRSHWEDETKARSYFIDKLNLKPGSRVLEIACGTGRDSVLIAKRLDASGQLVMVDITPNMLSICRDKLAGVECDLKFCVANAAYLPFQDQYFDAVYCFAAVGVFPDIKKSLAEMTRVTKIGGKVVFADESMPIWLRDTYFCKVFANTNPKVLWDVPLKEIPVQARNLTLQWVIGGIFYLIDYEVGEGEPTADFDYRIEGPVRGGTLRTRYEGKLEGVTKEAKEIAYKAAKKMGMTMHEWLDNAVKNKAKADLDID